MQRDNQTERDKHIPPSQKGRQNQVTQSATMNSDTPCGVAKLPPREKRSFVWSRGRALWTSPHPGSLHCSRAPFIWPPCSWAPALLTCSWNPISLHHSPATVPLTRSWNPTPNPQSVMILNVTRPHYTGAHSVGLEGHTREAQVWQHLSSTKAEDCAMSPSPHLYPRRNRHQPQKLTDTTLGVPSY